MKIMKFKKVLLVPALLLSATTPEMGQEQWEQVGAGGLEEIIVTARLTVENYQKMPASITAPDTEEIAAVCIKNPECIAALTPRSLYRAATNGGALLVIRGMLNIRSGISVSFFTDSVYVFGSMSVGPDLDLSAQLGYS